MTSSVEWIQKLMFLLMWNSGVWADDKICFQCATPELQNNWALTGLPMKPSTLVFDEKCDGYDADVLANEAFNSRSCSSYCFEFVIPLNGAHEYVRGCHADFVWDEFKVTNESCRLNLYSKGEKNLYAGTHFCPPTIANPEVEKCNKKWAKREMHEGTFLFCSDSDEVHTCKSCSEYDGSGSCSASTTGTCKAPYCTKTVGKFDGGSYESRGCAFFNPIGSNVCSWTDQTYNVTTGVDMTTARKKRAISMSFRADQCYCQGELCNSSPRLAALLLSLLSASLLVFL